MGFGLLFLGYFISTLMSVHAYGWATQILGFYLIFLALGKLSEYKHSFKYCYIPLVLMTLCQVFVGLRWLFTEFPTSALLSMITFFEIDSLLNTVSVMLFLIFLFFLLSSVRELALDVEDTDVAKLARRNMYIVGAYFVWNIATALIPPTNFSQTLTLISILAGFIYPISILYLLFRCYARICAPEDKDMEKKPSRFAFINKRREMSKKSDEKMEKMIQKLDAKKENQKK